MSSVPEQRRMTREAYLDFERAAERKHEFFRGEVFAMPGASRRHGLLLGNLFASLHEQLRQSECEIYPNDMRVRVSQTGLYTYPDIVIACDNPKFEDEHVDTLLTPTVLIEVLSDSTIDYDRGTKWKHYRQLDSLREYLMVAQDERSVEHYFREPRGVWQLRDEVPGEPVMLSSIRCRLNWDEVYARLH